MYVSPRYLTGSTHYLTKEEAYSRYPNNHWHDFVCEEDGTWSVYHLSRQPVQVGQVEYKGYQRKW